MKKTILDACCGGRMFWFNPQDERVMFIDKRKVKYELPDTSTKAGSRTFEVNPDMQADFTALPFDSNEFSLVVFDPPHLIKSGKTSWLARKYGKLEGDWRNEIRLGFTECFRVLKPEGCLVFKWNETDIPVSEVLSLTSEIPLFGNRCGKSSKSHWIVFLKPA